MSSNELMAKHSLLAMIAVEDSVTGLLLAKVGQVSDEPGKETYFLTVIPKKMTEEEVEEAFDRFTSGRDDSAILLTNQHIASRSDIQELSARRDIELFNGHQEPHSKDHNQVFFSFHYTKCNIQRFPYYGHIAFRPIFATLLPNS